MKVIKRDGKIEEYDFQKIERAVNKAFKSCKKEANEKLMNQLKEEFERFIEKCEGICEVPVDDIKDIIENFLIKKNQYDVVKASILERNRKDKAREQKSKLVKSIREKLAARNIQNQNANVDEASFGGRIGEASRVVTKEMALDYCMSEMAKNNHYNNEIYIHDLDSYAVGMHNCLTVPFDKLLAEGFNTRQTDVRPANSVNTAFQLVAVIFQLQSLQQFGGVSASHIDWTMVPYVRKSFMKHYKDGLKYFKGEDFPDLPDIPIEEMSIEHIWYGKYNSDYAHVYEYAMDMTVREIYQAVEGMYHNLNTLQSRSGNQLPFTSINYGTCTELEGRLVTKAILDVSIEGLGRLHKTPIFPCGIFQCKKGINRAEGDKNYDLYQLALKSTAKRLYPNYANVDWSVGESWVKKDRDDKETYINSLNQKDREKLIEILKTDKNLSNFLDLKVVNGYIVVEREEKPSEMFSTMGCRTVNGHDVNFLDSYKENIQSVIKGEGLKYDDCESGAQKDGRGNIAPVTIILPTIAMEAFVNESKRVGENMDVVDDNMVEEFFRLLDQKIYEAKDMLIERFNWVCQQPAQSGKFMYENKTMEGYDGKTISSALKHGTLTIGQLGIAEACQILVHCDQTEERGMEIAKRIEKLYNQRCAEFKKEYKLNFGVYYTPAENLCNTALKNFRKKYGIIKNVSDKEFFTNSMHVPVWRDMDPFKKIDIESELTSYSNAGCITYVELPSSCEHNTEALEMLVNYAMDHDIPYFAVNVPNDQCQECGWTGEIGEICPVCGSGDIQRLRRVTGYLTGNYTTAFNAGKVDEVEHRVKHIKN